MDTEYKPYPIPVTEIMAAPVEGRLVRLQVLIVGELIEAEKLTDKIFTRLAVEI